MRFGKSYLPMLIGYVVPVTCGLMLIVFSVVFSVVLLSPTDVFTLATARHATGRSCSVALQVPSGAALWECMARGADIHATHKGGRAQPAMPHTRAGTGSHAAEEDGHIQLCRTPQRHLPLRQLEML